MREQPIVNVYQTLEATAQSAIRDSRQEIHVHTGQPVGPPFQAPRLPEFFVPRPEFSDRLKADLLADGQSAQFRAMVVHGLPGVGKSTSVAAFARQTREHFHHGILWAYLGQEPDITSLLSGWIQALGDYGFRTTNPDVAAGHLRSLLEGKTVLLVIDDVWSPDHSRPFLAGGAQCRAIVTTRRVDIADELGIEPIELSEMTEDQALALFARRLSRNLEDSERNDAKAVATRLEFLPLALELAAIRVKKGVPWDSLLDSLSKEMVRLETLEGPRRSQQRLYASFNLSLNALRQDDDEAWQAFAWLGILRVDASINVRVAAVLWDVNEAEAVRILDLLWNESLLLKAIPILVNGTAERTYRINNLLHDFAIRLLTRSAPQGLDYTMVQAHAKLIDQYRGRCQGMASSGARWYTLRDDGYIHEHLLWHLERAELVTEIHQVLAEETPDGKNGWFVVRDRLGQVAGYMRDVSRAWEIAHRQSLESLNEGNMSPDIGLQIRYALMTASVYNIAGRIPPPLFGRLLKSNTWKPQQALAYAQLQPNDPYGFDTAKTLALREIVPYLPEPLLLKVISDEWIKLRGPDAELISLVIGQLKQQAIDSAFDDLSSTVRNYSQLTALLPIAARLEDSERREKEINIFLETAQEFNEFSRLDFLVKLIRFVDLPQREDTINEILGIFHSSNEEKLLAALQDWLKTAFSARSLLFSWWMLLSMQRQIHQLWFEEGLLPFIPWDADEDISRMSQNQFLDWFWDASESGLVFMKGKRQSFIIQALHGYLSDFAELTGQYVGHDCFRNWIRGIWAPDPEASKTIRDCLFVQAIIWMRTALDELAFGDMLHLCGNISIPGVRFVAYTQLLPFLDGEQHRAVVDECLSLANQENGAKRLLLLSMLGRDLRAPALEQLLQSFESYEESVREIKDPSGRHKYTNEKDPTLYAVIDNLASVFTPKQALRALERVKRIKDDSDRLNALTLLVPKLDEAHASWVANDITSKTEDRGGLIAMIRLTRYRQEPSVDEVFGEIRRLKSKLDTDAIREVLGEFASILPESKLLEALSLSQEIGDTDSQDKTLEALIPKLVDARQLDEALQAARSIRDKSMRAMSLCAASEGFDDQRRIEIAMEAIGPATSLESWFSRQEGGAPSETRAKTLLCVARHLPEPHRSQVLDDALTTELAKEDPDSEGLPRFRPDPEGLVQICGFLAQIGRVEESLEIAQRIQDESTKVDVVAAIAPTLNESQLHVAWGLIELLDNERLCAVGINALAKYLPVSLQNKAREMIGVMDEPNNLLASAGFWTSRQDELIEAQPTLTEQRPSQESAISAILRHVYASDENGLVHAFLQKAKEAAPAADTAAFLEQLAPFLKMSEIEAALTIAESINDLEWKDRALCAIVQRLAGLGAVSKSLSQLRDIKTPRWLAEAISYVVAFLPSDHESLRSALTIANALYDNGIPDVDKHILDGETDASWLDHNRRFELKVMHRHYYMQALNALAPKMTVPFFPGVCESFYKLLREGAASSRHETLSYIRAMANIIERLGGASALAATKDAVLDACRWWP